MIGLNLRMTEQTAAIACAQLAKVREIIAGRIALAEELTAMVSGVPWIKAQVADVGCRHVYYKWVARILDGKRDDFVRMLNERGFPMEARYSIPLNRVFDKSQSCPMAETLNEFEFINFEVCGWAPKARHIRRMSEVMKSVIGKLD